jgi:hypothetical protein
VRAQELAVRLATLPGRMAALRDKLLVRRPPLGE